MWGLSGLFMKVFLIECLISLQFNENNLQVFWANLSQLRHNSNPANVQDGESLGTLYKGDDALSTKLVMHYYGTAYLCY